MMRHLTRSKQEALEKAQYFYKRGMNHPTQQLFFDNVMENRGIFDGDVNAHWDEKSRSVLESRGQVPLVVNLTQSFIKTLLGVEIQNRHQVTFHSDVPTDAQAARGISHGLYRYNEHRDVNKKKSLIYRDFLNVGIGWSRQYVDSGQLYYEHVDPLKIITDWDDLSEDFIDSKFRGCRFRLDIDEVKHKWPHAARCLDLDQYDNWGALQSPQLEDRLSNGLEWGRKRSDDTVLVCEMQYKTNKYAYKGLDKLGRPFQTFSIEDAEKMADSKKDIEEFSAKRTMRTLFIDDVLLEHSPLDPDFPDLSDYSYIPGVLQKDYKTNMPLGLVNQVKTLQRDLNARVCKSLYSINSSRIIINGSLPPSMTLEQLRHELSRSDSILISPHDTKIDVQSNASSARDHIEIMREYLNLFQRLTGIYDEVQGAQTNATSGIAQQYRMVNSTRNNVYGFDNFMFMKKREARLFLQLLQSTKQKNIFIETLGEEEKEEIWLNLHRVCEVSGKEVVINNIQNIPLSIYIEEVPDYKTIAEENTGIIKEILGNPILMQNPDLLELFPAVRPDLIDKLKTALKGNEAMQQATSPGVSQGQLPSPAAPSLDPTQLM